MGSTLSERRDLLERIAYVLADAHAGCDVDPAADLAAYVELDGREIVLGLRPFDEHPTEVPWEADVQDSWWALVLTTRGRAHLLDAPDRGPEQILSTFARSRDGHEVSLLRRGDTLTELPGRAEGRIPDLLRRLLPACTRGRP
jgi:hypothetical protein